MKLGKRSSGIPWWK